MQIGSGGEAQRGWRARVRAAMVVGVVLVAGGAFVLLGNGDEPAAQIDLIGSPSTAAGGDGPSERSAPAPTTAAPVGPSTTGPSAITAPSAPAGPGPTSGTPEAPATTADLSGSAVPPMPERDNEGSPAPEGGSVIAPAGAVEADTGTAERHDFGTSVAGRTLTAWRRAGSGQPTRREVVIGVIHGEEPAGRAITDLLLTLPLPPDLELWLVPTLNPDGEAAGQRGNANGVDLNRNFPAGWLPPGSDPFTSGGYHSGAGPASEPEVQAALALIRHVRPHRTIWYHQPWDVVICEVAHAGRLCTDYAARVGLEATSAPRPGSSIGWQEYENLGAALVVELAEGPAPAEVVGRHAAAVLAG